VLLTPTLQWLPAGLMVPVIASHSIGLGFRHTLNALGLMVTPATPFKLGRVSPAGTQMSKECSSEEKNEKISILARISPRHILLPTPNGKKYSGLTTLPSALTNLLGSNFSGSFHRFGSMCTECSRGTIWACLGR
jgi:hypothetical protein